MRIESLDKFLQSLTDKELAFFFEYRRNEFMQSSKNKIILELKSRNLTDARIANLIKPIKEIDLEHCSRCGSNKFEQIKETELRGSGFGGYEVEIFSRKCRVCGYNPRVDKPLNWQVRWYRFLGRYSWIKLK